MFERTYFEMFKKSTRKIRSYEAIAKIIKLLNQPHNFVHAIFLISKVDYLLLNQMHIRIIVIKNFHIYIYF